MPTPTTPAARRYVLRFGTAMAVYVAVIFAVSAWFASASPPVGATKYAAAAAPALPVLAAIWAMGAYLVELPDEYQRLRLATAALWSMGFTLAICTVWGFLQNYAGVPTPPLYAVFILFAFLLGVVQCARQLSGR